MPYACRAGPYRCVFQRENCLQCVPIVIYADKEASNSANVFTLYPWCFSDLMHPPKTNMSSNATHWNEVFGTIALGSSIDIQRSDGTFCRTFMISTNTVALFLSHVFGYRCVFRYILFYIAGIQPLVVIPFSL